MIEKRCRLCDLDLPLRMFRKTPKGHSYRCKHCDSRIKELRSGNFENIQLYIMDAYFDVYGRKVETKRCRYCGYIKPVSQFRKTTTKYADRCLLCDNRTREEINEAYVRFKEEIEDYYESWDYCFRERRRKEREETEKKYAEIIRLEGERMAKLKAKRKEDRYISTLLVQSGVPKEAITDELIDFKRAHLHLKRELKKLEK